MPVKKISRKGLLYNLFLAWPTRVQVHVYPFASADSLYPLIRAVGTKAFDTLDFISFFLMTDSLVFLKVNRILYFIYASHLIPEMP